MFSPTRECPRCGGTGYRPLFGRLHIECRSCGGTGWQLKLSARIWYRLRYGSGQE
jgi:DnaJ-class molecular chaperone